MDRGQIIEELAKEKKVEKFISNVNKGSLRNQDLLDDLAQDIYFSLLTKDNIEELYEKGELDYYVSKMVINQLKSTNSPFYYTYRKNNKDNITLDGLDRYI